MATKPMRRRQRGPRKGEGDKYWHWILTPTTDEERAELEASLKEARTKIGAAYKEKCAALEAAFNRLPEPPATEGNGIPYKKLIPGIARELMLMRPVQKRERAPVKKSLQKMATHAAGTVEALDSLPPDIVTGLNLEPAAFRQLKLMLRILPILAKSVEVGTRPRATTKVQPREIARRVAEHYCALTGRPKPTVPSKDGVPYGPFLDLLTTVFRVLGVKASARSQGKAIQTDWQIK